MSGLIYADDILPLMERKMDMQDLYLPIHFQEMVIDEMPTVDAVEVVHCRDCKYWWAEERQCMDEIGFARRWDANDYCSNGKRREP